MEMKIKKDQKKINNMVSEEKVQKYFEVTGKALKICSQAMDKKRIKESTDFLDMAQRYFDDANYFYNKGDYVLAFAALNYSHGWLDAGARIKLFEVYDSELFTVDEK